jgi:hypothetical protein
MGDTYERLVNFKKRFPGTVSWRLKAHAKVIDKHLNPEEEVQYVFAAQRGLSSLELFNTYAIAVTNKRILLVQKRLLFGYMLVSITPDMFNDLTVASGIIWGKVIIDTVKEVVTFSNISKKAVYEIETTVTEMMMREKQKYAKIEKDTTY